MWTEWTSHLSTPEEKEQFEREIFSAKRVLNRQKALIDKRLDGLERTEEKIEAYDSPSWSHKQAYINGYRAALKTQRITVDLDSQLQRPTE